MFLTKMLSWYSQRERAVWPHCRVLYKPTAPRAFPTTEAGICSQLGQLPVGLSQTPSVKEGQALKKGGLFWLPVLGQAEGAVSGGRVPKQAGHCKATLKEKRVSREDGVHIG